MQVKIEQLGAQGDGIANLEGKVLHIEGALPDEIYDLSGETPKRVQSSPQRVEPICPQSFQTGICSAQHMSEDLYVGWKSRLIEQALGARGIETQVKQLIPTLPHERRRAEFSARKTQDGIVLGFHKKESKTILGVDECIVLKPQIIDCIPTLKAIAKLAAGHTKGEMRFAVTLADNGLDVSFSGPKSVSDKLRQELTKLTLKSSLLRLSFGDEILVEKRAPVLSFKGIEVQLPPQSFTQATQSAQNVMTDLVCESLTSCKQVADLFCGIGTFTLPLAQQSKVNAYESHIGAIKALDRASRFAQGIKTLKIERRDLFRTPLIPRELKKLDGLVFDPPRAGAEEQVKQIAQSNLRKIVAVSCNPASFARDARILIDGGYKLKWAQPIDQFLYSHHLELVALFERS